MNKNQTQFLTGFLIAAVIFGAVGGGAYVVTQTSLLDRFNKNEVASTETASEIAASTEMASEPVTTNQHPHQAQLDKLKPGGYLYWDKPTDKYYMKDGTEFPVDEVFFLEDGTPITSGLAEQMRDEDDAKADAKMAATGPKIHGHLTGGITMEEMTYIFTDDASNPIFYYSCDRNGKVGYTVGSNDINKSNGFFYDKNGKAVKISVDGENVQLALDKIPYSEKGSDMIFNAFSSVVNGKYVTVNGKTYTVSVDPEIEKSFSTCL